MIAARPKPVSFEPVAVPVVGSVAARRRARTRRASSPALRRAGSAVALAATLLLTAYIGEYATVARASYQRAALHKELYRARQENSLLHGQVETLERPDRIDHLARAMNMEQRNEAEYVSLAPLPAPAAPARPRPIIAGFLPESWTHIGSSRR